VLPPTPTLDELTLAVVELTQQLNLLQNDLINTLTLIEGINYGIGQCMAAAHTMAQQLTKRGNPPLFAEFMFTGAFDKNDGSVLSITGGIYSPGMEISTSGYHFGRLLWIIHTK
jgi:hypothetical protein